MNGQQLVAVGLLLLVGIGGAAAPVSGYPATTIGAGAPADQGMSASNNTTMGAQISSFMQSSSASAESGVESGMWEESFERAPSEKRPELVNERVGSLEKRLQRLEQRRASLLESENVTMAERARAARLAARAKSLREAINTTDRAAKRTGVNTSKLDELRDQARNVTGREVARMAPGVGPDNNESARNRAPPGKSDDQVRSTNGTPRADTTRIQGSNGNGAESNQTRGPGTPGAENNQAENNQAENRSNGLPKANASSAGKDVTRNVSTNGRSPEHPRHGANRSWRTGPPNRNDSILPLPASPSARTNNSTVGESGIEN